MDNLMLTYTVRKSPSVPREPSTKLRYDIVARYCERRLFKVSYPFA